MNNISIWKKNIIVKNIPGYKRERKTWNKGQKILKTSSHYYQYFEIVLRMKKKVATKQKFKH